MLLTICFQESYMLEHYSINKSLLHESYVTALDFFYLQ
jgi:hypothetical protein